MTRFVRSCRLAAVVVTIGAAVLVGPRAWSDGPAAELSLGTFGGGGGESSSAEYSTELVLGQPEAEASQGDGIALVPGPIGGQVSAADACPGVDGSADYEGCPAGVSSSITLKITDQRARPSACGTKPSCSFAVADAPVRLFDRTKLDGLTITARDGSSATLTKNPSPSLYDDIFESTTAHESARAADYGCRTDTAGTCLAGVRAATDLLLLVRCTDGSTLLYAGRSLSFDSFVDDLATESLHVIKQYDRNGKVTYGGAKTGVVTG